MTGREDQDVRYWLTPAGCEAVSPHTYVNGACSSCGHVEHR